VQEGRALYAEFMKVRDLIKILHEEGWVLKNQEGSHRQYTHPRRQGKVTIAGHPMNWTRRPRSLYLNKLDLNRLVCYEILPDFDCPDTNGF
jgi:predicted RNA binding protein YcfA (HicA-like mRNA interferase family)